nr:hypothetical protein [Tanacetum cinerariifolium]
MPPKPDLVFHDASNVNETVHTAFHVELSLTKPDKYLSPSHRPSALIIEDWVSDIKDESEAEPTQNAPSFVQPLEHAKTPRPSVKPVEHQVPAESLRQEIPKSRGNRNSKNKKEFFILLTRSKLVRLYAARPVTAAVPQPHVTRPRPTKNVITKSHLPLRWNINRSPSHNPSNFPQKVTTAEVSQGNPQHTLKDKGVI